MTAEPVDPADGTGAGPADAPLDLDRALEALLMVADEPQSVTTLAKATSTPVKEVRRAIQRLVDDFDGTTGGVRRGFELREVGGGWRVYVRPEFDTVIRAHVLTQTPRASRRRPSRRSR